MRTPRNQGPRHQDPRKQGPRKKSSRLTGSAMRIVGPTLALGLVALLTLATAAPAAAGDVKGKISYGQR